MKPLSKKEMLALRRDAQAMVGAIYTLGRPFEEGDEPHDWLINAMLEIESVVGWLNDRLLGEPTA